MFLLLHNERFLAMKISVDTQANVIGFFVECCLREKKKNIRNWENVVICKLMSVGSHLSFSITLVDTCIKIKSEFFSIYL